jgi:hypothetical protein
MRGPPPRSGVPHRRTRRAGATRQATLPAADSFSPAGHQLDENCQAYVLNGLVSFRHGLPVICEIRLPGMPPELLSVIVLLVP